MLIHANHVFVLIVNYTFFRYDYLKALHIDPTCLAGRVNLGYNLQVRKTLLSVTDMFDAKLVFNNRNLSFLG